MSPQKRISRSPLPAALLAAAAAGLSAATIALAAPPAPAAAAPAPTNARIFGGTTTDPTTLAERAYVWGYPLVQAAQARVKSTDPADPFAKRPANDGTAPLDNIGAALLLSSPPLKSTTPNTDTLYSQAWLDMDHGPFVLLTPTFGTRYYTFQAAQYDTSTQETLGQRLFGAKLPPLFIYGPDYHGSVPAGMRGVRSRFRYLFLLGRILVDPDVHGDYAAVHALQDRVRLLTYRRYRAGARGGRNPVPSQAPLDRPSDIKRLQFLYELSRVMADIPASREDRALRASLTKIGLRAGSFTPPAGAEAKLAAGLAAGARDVPRAAANYGTVENGWSIGFQGPEFGDDWLRRSVVSLTLPFVNLPRESLYPKATTDAHGRPLVGSKTYDIHFAAGQLPPVRFFWSLIAYDAAGHLVANPLKRYEIGDRTAGLVKNDDGSLDVIVSHRRPTGRLAANWLPAPPGRFFFVLRLYDARASVFDRTWRPPPIELR